MPRLESMKEKQFVETPPITLECIKKMLMPKSGARIRILDPCAGNGRPAMSLAQHLRQKPADADEGFMTPTVEVYGVEPDPHRGAQVLELMGPERSLNCAWEGTRTSTEAWSLLFENPPYSDEFVADEDNKFQRQELTFLQKTEAKLQMGGVLIFIIQLHRLAKRSMAHMLATHFGDLQVFAVPDAEWEPYHQIVVMGVRQPYRENEAAIEWLMQLPDNKPEPIDQATDVTLYVVPGNNKIGILFQEDKPSDEKLLQLIKSHGAQHDRKWKDYINPRTDITFTPVLPLSQGHISSLIASGQTGLIVLPANDKHPASIIRGQAIKTLIGFDSQGNPVEPGSPDCAKEREVFSMEIYQRYANGRHRVLTAKDVTEFKALLELNAGPISRVVKQKYAPLYEGTADPQAWKKLDKLMQGRPLPGRTKSGLLPAQKHAIVALATALNFHTAVNLTAEPGCGKTLMGTAIAYQRDAWPALAMVPPHVVGHWKAEFEAAVPGGKAVIAEHVADISRFIKHYKQGEKQLLICSFQTHKLGPGLIKLNKPQKVNYYRGVVFPKLTAAKKLDDPNAKRYEKPKFADQVMPSRRPTKREILDMQGRVVGYRKGVFDCCPKCGALIEIKRGKKLPRCQAKIEKGKWDPVNEKWIETKCGEKLYQYGPLHKWPGAEYIYHKHRGVFKVLLADEVHETKALGTDNGMAYHLLTLACPKTINLTGTMIGGKSTDIFPNLYRTSPQVRAAYNYDDGQLWASHYGRLEMTYEIQDDEREVSKSTGKTRRCIDADEKPGLSPTVFQWVLPNTVFMQLKHLGYKMVPYQEHVVRLDMSPLQRKQYQWLDDTLYDAVMERIAKPYPSKQERREAIALLSRWMSETLYHGQAAYRTNTVMWADPNRADPDARDPWPLAFPTSYKYGYTAQMDAADAEAGKQDLYATGKALDARGNGGLGDDPEHTNSEPMTLLPVVPIDGLLPKEAWLVKLAKAEQAAKRRMIVYISETNTRDIQPRVQAILNRNGIRAEIMPDMKPAKREQWIKQNAGRMDVLLVNPNKVKTGLNLIQFATVVMYEAQTSLFTVMQAIRRPYRPTQTLPINVYFPVYKGSMEERILRLIANKARTAAILYGNPDETALMDAGDDDDIMAALVKEAMSRAQVDFEADSVMAELIVPTETVLGEGEEELETPTAEFDEAPIAEEEETAAVQEDDESAGETLFDQPKATPAAIKPPPRQEPAPAYVWDTWQQLQKQAAAAKQTKTKAAQKASAKSSKQAQDAGQINLFDNLATHAAKQVQQETLR